MNMESVAILTVLALSGAAAQLGLVSGIPPLIGRPSGKWFCQVKSTGIVVEAATHLKWILQ